MWPSFIFVGWVLLKCITANFHIMKKVNNENYETIKDTLTSTFTECVLSCRNNTNCTDVIANEGNEVKGIPCTLLKLKKKNGTTSSKMETVIKGRKHEDVQVISPV